MTIKINYKDIKNKALGVALILLLVASLYSFSAPSWSVHSGSTPAPVPSISWDRSFYGTEQVEQADLKVIDFSENANPSAIDEVTVDVSSLRDPAGIEVTLRETGTDTAVFVGSVTFTYGSSDDPHDLLQVDIGDVVTASYTTGAVIPAGTYHGDVIASIENIGILERGIENAAVPKFDLNVHSVPVTPTTIKTKAMVGHLDISNNPGRSVDPRIVASGSNGYMVWRDNSIGNYDILFRAATDNGTSLENEQNLSKNVGSSVLQSIAASGSNVYVGWSDSTLGKYDILFRASNDNGNTWNPPLDSEATNLSSNPGFSIVPQIAASGSSVYAVWRDTGTSSTDIFFRASNDNGATFGSVQNLSDNTGFSTAPKLVASGSSVHVVWIDNSSGNYDIFFMGSSDNGNTWNVDLGGDPFNVSDNAGSSSAPEIAVFDDDVYILWRDNTPGNYDIFLRGSNDNGNSFGSVQNLSSNPGNSHDPRIAASDKNVYTLWRQSNELFVRASDDTGSSFSGAVSVINGYQKPYNPQLVASEENVYVLWRDNSVLIPGKSAIEIHLAASVNEGASFEAALNISNNPTRSISPKLAASGNHTFALWVDGSLGNNEIDFGAIELDKRGKNFVAYKVGKHLHRDIYTAREWAWDAETGKYVAVKVKSASDTVVMTGSISVKFKETVLATGSAVVREVDFYEADYTPTSTPMVTEKWIFRDLGSPGSPEIEPDFTLSEQDIVQEGSNVNVTLRSPNNFSVTYVFREGQPLKHEVVIPDPSSSLTAVQRWNLSSTSYATNLGQVDIPAGAAPGSIVANLPLNCEALQLDPSNNDQLCEVETTGQGANYVQFNLGSEPIATEIFKPGIGNTVNVQVTKLTGQQIRADFTYAFPPNSQVLDPLTCTTGCTVLNQDGHGLKNVVGTGSSCTGSNNRQVSDTYSRIRVPASTSTTGSCTRTFIDWNIGIGQPALNAAADVTNVSIGYNVAGISPSLSRNCEITSMIQNAADPMRPSALTSHTALWNEIGNEPYFADTSLPSTERCNTTGWKSIDLSDRDPDSGRNPENDIEDNLDDSNTWYAVGIKFVNDDPNGRGSTLDYSNITPQGSSPYPTLTITYT